MGRMAWRMRTVSTARLHWEHIRPGTTKLAPVRRARMTAPSLPSRAQWSQPTTFSKLVWSSWIHQHAGESDRPQALLLSLIYLNLILNSFWPSSTRPQSAPSVVVWGWQGCGVCVHVRKTPHLQHPVVRVLAMATTPVGSCSNLGSLMRAVSLKPHLGCFCFAHVMGRKCSYVTFLFAGCRKICVHVEYQNSKFDFFKKETHLFL